MKNKDLKDFQKKMSQEYQKTYSNTIMILLVIVLFKRFLTDPHFSFLEFLMLALVTLIFNGLKMLFSYNDFTMRYTPFLFAVYSYSCHSFILFKKTENYISSTSIEDSTMIQMTKDHFFKFII